MLTNGSEAGGVVRLKGNGAIEMEPRWSKDARQAVGPGTPQMALVDGNRRRTTMPAKTPTLVTSQSNPARQGTDWTWDPWTVSCSTLQAEDGRWSGCCTHVFFLSHHQELTKICCPLLVTCSQLWHYTQCSRQKACYSSSALLRRPHLHQDSHSAFSSA